MSNTLELLAQAQKTGPNAMIDALVAGGHIDPDKRAMLDLMMMQQSGLSESIEDEDYAEPEDTGAQEDLEARTLFLASADRIDQLEALTEQLALALGACVECLGTDTGCPSCGGKGRPGSRSPRRREFEKFVLPVLNRMKRDRPLRHAQPAPTPEQTHGPMKGVETHGTGTD